MVNHFSFSVKLYVVAKEKINDNKEIKTKISSDNRSITNLNSGCNYDKQQNPEKQITILPASDRCWYIVNKIMSFSGLNPNFEIYEAEINNALATIIENRRIILYDPKLLNFTDYASDSYWSSISVLAHEIGHHLSGHTLISTEDNHTIELEADKFSGFILYKMGASLQEAKKAMNILANNFDTETHPSKSKRLKAIEKGWNDANQQKYESAIPPPPIDDYQEFYIEEFFENQITSDYLQEYRRVQSKHYKELNDALFEGIIIDIEKANADDYSHNTGCTFHNIILNIHITKSYTRNKTTNGKIVGERDLFYMINYCNLSNAELSNLEGIIKPGRKIRFKSYYYGHGAEDIIYLKKMNRNENTDYPGFAKSLDTSQS